MSTLELLLLGVPIVRRDGAPIEVKPRRSLALLAYLALTAQHHARDTLADLMFPGHDREASRAGIRQILSLLRSAVGGERIRADRTSAWMEDGGGLRVDVRDMRGLCAAAREARRDGDAARAISLHLAAENLCRGELLSGFFLKDSTAFEDWQEAEAEDLRRVRAANLEKLTALHEEHGDHSQAIVTARRWLSFDPTDESAHRALMRAYALAGDRAAALRHFESCREVLSAEVGAAPDPETERLRATIAAGRLAAPGRGTAPSSGRRPRPRAQGAMLLASSNADGTARRVEAVETLAEAARAAANACGAEPGAHYALCARESEARYLLLTGHPGQILVSPAALGGGPPALPAGMGIRPLGTYRLKDLGPAQPVHQLLHPDLRQEFPPLRTLDACPNNLRVQPDAFIGREREREDVVGRMTSPGTTLVTLTGPGGTGKTRLALHCAAELTDVFPDGVFFVDLSNARNPDDAIARIASEACAGVITTGDRSLREAVSDFLAPRAALLVLDNLEQLSGAGCLVDGLLGTSARLKIIATSREPLHIRAEREYPVPPLGLPVDGTTLPALQKSEAVRLFALRAASIVPDFSLGEENAAVVGRMCVLLDGLPLAIELSVCRLKVFPLPTLLGLLERRLDALKDGPRDLPPRQRSLRSELDWSWDLLDEREKGVFTRLAVFVGGFTLEGAEAVCASADGSFADILGSLCDKSLVHRQAGGGDSRFRMLQVIREYALERLEERGEQALSRDLMARHLRELAEEAEPKLLGPDQEEWLDRLDEEHANMLAALVWLRDSTRVVEGLRLAGALGWYWFRRGRFKLGEEWLVAMRTRATDADPAPFRAKVAYHLGWMKLCVSRVFDGVPEGAPFFEEALALFRQTGDERGIALCLAWLASARFSWSSPREQGDPALTAHVDRAIEAARTTKDPWTIAWSLKLGYSLFKRHKGDRDVRIAGMQEAVELARRTGDSFLVCQMLKGLGDIHRGYGEFAKALPWYREALELAQEIDDTFSVIDTSNRLSLTFLDSGNTAEAFTLCADTLRLAVDHGARGYYAWLIGGLDYVARRQGRICRAGRLWAAAAACADGYVKPCEPTMAPTLGITEELAASLWAEGQAMTLDRAVDYALSDND